MTSSLSGGRPLPPWLAEWEPPGLYDERTRVFHADTQAPASFPREGIDVFSDVDEGSFWFEHRAKVILELIANCSPATSRILEVGSGSGAVAARMASVGHEVMVVEPHDGAAASARARGVSLAFQGTLAEANLPANSFDVVGLFDVVEHLEDWHDVLSQSRRVLRADGHLVVTVPAYQWLWSEHDEWNEHKRRYSASLLEQHLTSAGFEITEVAPFFGALVLPALVRRLGYLAGVGGVDDHERRLRSQLEPGPLVNRILGGVLGFERAIMARVSLPIGTSLYAVASPKGIG